MHKASVGKQGLDSLLKKDEILSDGDAERTMDACIPVLDLIVHTKFHLLYGIN